MRISVRQSYCIHDVEKEMRERERRREAPLIGRWNVAAILGVYEPRYIRFSLASLSFFPSLILSLSLLFVSHLPSLRFYPVVKRRRVTWTQDDQYKVPQPDLVSLVLSHLFYLAYPLSLLFSVSVLLSLSISHNSISPAFATSRLIFDISSENSRHAEKRSRLFNRDWNFSLFTHSHHSLRDLARIYKLYTRPLLHTYY